MSLEKCTMSFIENCTIVLVWKNVLGIQIWWTVLLKVLLKKNKKFSTNILQWSMTDKKINKLFYFNGQVGGQLSAGALLASLRAERQHLESRHSNLDMGIQQLSNQVNQRVQSFSSSSSSSSSYSYSRNGGGQRVNILLLNHLKPVRIFQNRQNIIYNLDNLYYVL